MCAYRGVMQRITIKAGVIDLGLFSVAKKNLHLVIKQLIKD